MSWVIAIPSFNRCKIFEKKTLKFLEKYELKERAVLYLQTDEDENDYADFGIKIERSPLGLVNTINFIWETQEVDQEIWLLHDDVSKFVDLYGEVEDLESIITNCFEILREKGGNLGGFYPTPNPLWMGKSKEITEDCRFIHDPCCLVINQRVFNTDNFVKSDFERTVLYYKRDKKIIRFNHYSFITSYNPKSVGGVGHRSAEQELNDAEAFRDAYPEFVRCIRIHKRGTTSIILKTPTCDSPL